MNPNPPNRSKLKDLMNHVSGTFCDRRKADITNWETYTWFRRISKKWFPSPCIPNGSAGFCRACYVQLNTAQLGQLLSVVTPCEEQRSYECSMKARRHGKVYTNDTCTQPSKAKMTHPECAQSDRGHTQITRIRVKLFDFATGHLIRGNKPLKEGCPIVERDHEGNGFQNGHLRSRVSGEKPNRHPHTNFKLDQRLTKTPHYAFQNFSGLNLSKMCECMYSTTIACTQLCLKVKEAATAYCFAW
jgi:hypothetical protein